MAHNPALPQQETDTTDAFLKYAGVAGIAIAVLLTVAVAALTVGPALLAGKIVAPALFTLLLVAVVVFLRRLHKARGRQMDVDPDWH